MNEEKQTGWRIADIVEQWKHSIGIPVHMEPIMNNERPPKQVGVREEIAYDHDNAIATLIRGQNLQGKVPTLFPMFPDLMVYLLRRGCQFKIKPNPYEDENVTQH